MGQCFQSKLLKLLYIETKWGDLKQANGGDDWDRTSDLLHAMQTLSQLSYAPNSNHIEIE